jgi:serine/threonine-protein kinase HipA
MKKQGFVYMNSLFAGIIEQNDEGFIFEYDKEYLDNAKAISLTLPLQHEPFFSKTMIPFFDGLIPEGWLLLIAHQVLKIDTFDRMDLLLACCEDTIGAVSVRRQKI